jgi:hypothetical protein
LSATRPLRLVVYDRTDVRSKDTGLVPRVVRREDGSVEGTGGLTPFWRLGGVYHRALLRADGVLGAATWKEALAWASALAERRGAPIGELQAWGHGGWGYMRMGETRLDAATIDGELAAEMDAFCKKLAPGPESLVWLRCCSAFGQVAGRAFARALADRTGVRVCSHTYVIGVWQSGTRSVAPGEEPSWSEREGTLYDESGRPTGADTSRPGEPRTLTALRPGLPAGW